MKHASSLLLLAAGLAAAQSTTVVDILMPLADPQAIVGSVVSAGPSTTVYVIRCAPSVNSDDCGLPDGMTVTNGPSTMEYTASAHQSMTLSAQCSYDLAEDTGVCTGADISGTSTYSVTESLTGWSTLFLPVTVTGGVEKLSGAPATTGAGVTTTAAGPTATTMTTTTTTTAGGLAGGPATAQSSSAAAASVSTSTGTSTSTSTGGVMPRATRDALVLGAAALLGGAMLI